MSKGAGIIDTPTVKRIEKTEAEWKLVLKVEEYEILRNKDTERPGSGEYNKCKDKGVYCCRACGNPLYTYKSKFDSGCGWPAFDRHIPGSIKTVTDETFGMKRVEIMCGACDGHLGHVFEGESYTETNTRHCVNSLSVRLNKELEVDDDGKIKSKS